MEERISENVQPPEYIDIYDYRKDKNNLLDKLKRLRDYAGELELPDSATHAATTIARMENSPFRIAVVGEFNRGKSTLINALLGSDILPTDVLACTATLNRITYGKPASVRLVYKATDEKPKQSEDISVEQLKDYITKLTEGSKRKVEDIEEAIVFYPLRYLEFIADIIDTPGLNDEGTMDKITYSVLPTVDAAIMIVSAHAALAATEGDFLNHQILGSDIGRVLFVINHIDQIRRPEDIKRLEENVVERITNSVEQRAAAIYGKGTEEYESFRQRIGIPKVFPLSALDALEGKMGKDDEMLARSRFTEFEHALERFLANDAGVVSAQVLTECIRNTGAHILQKININEGALRMRAQEFEVAYQTASMQLQGLREKQDAELRKVDGAANRALARSRQVLEELGGILKEAATQAVDSTQISPDEMKRENQGKLKEKMVANVQAGISLAAQQASTKMQLEIENEVVKEITRLQDFAAQVRSVLGNIVMQFITQSGGEKEKLEKYDLALGTAISTFAGFGLGGIWTGYKEGGLKGAAAGGLAGLGAWIGTAFTSAAVVILLGLPFTWPVGLGMAIVSSFASAVVGKRAAQRVGFDERIVHFKDEFKNQILADIDKQLDKQRLSFDRALVEQVTSIFDALKQNIKQEFGNPIEQTQKTLDDLRERQTRTKAEVEMESARLAEIETDTLNIQKVAVAKANTLRMITSV